MQLTHFDLQTAAKQYNKNYNHTHIYHWFLAHYKQRIQYAYILHTTINRVDNRLLITKEQSLDSSQAIKTFVYKQQYPPTTPSFLVHMQLE